MEAFFRGFGGACNINYYPFADYKDLRAPCKNLVWDSFNPYGYRWRVMGLRYFSRGLSG
jgi:hypothetical protein